MKAIQKVFFGRAKDGSLVGGDRDTFKAGMFP
jgi:hypothetical protein